MDNLTEYRLELVNALRSESGLNGTSINEEFISRASELLCGAEEIPEDIHYCYFEGIGQGGKRKIQLNGYTYNDFDSSLILYVIPDTEYTDELITLTTEEADRYFSRCFSFISEAAWIRDNAEESHPAYGLAYDIAEKQYRDLQNYQICILTDRILSRTCKVKSPEKIDGITLEYRIIDIERLCQIENSLNGKVAIEINLDEFTNGKGIPCMLANSTQDYQSYLCNIPGLVLANLYNTYGSRLLEGNVRSFLQQKNKVNKGIRTTILKEPENFFVYNNGITATADEVVLDESNHSLTYVKGLQIVNGGQTTASLAACLLNDKKENSEEQIARICVPMKLTVIPYDKAVNLIPNISRYANSQNKVSEADLWSNHPFHVKMEEISRRMITPIVNGKTYGTYWFYERARGQYKQSTYKKSEAERKKFEAANPKSQLMTKTDFAKYYNIRELRPDFASLGGEKSFFKAATKIRDAWDKNNLAFNEAFFHEMVAIAIIYKDVDVTVKKQSREYKANIDAYTVSLLLYLINRDLNGFINYKDIWNKQAVRPELHDQLLILIDYVYEILTSPSRTVENVTEWAKRETCWNIMKDCNIRLSDNIASCVFTQNEYLELEMSAKREEKELNGAQSMMRVFELGSDYWKKLLEWNKESNIFTSKEISIISIATDMGRKYPSEKQCISIIKALNKAKDNGFLG